MSNPKSWLSISLTLSTFLLISTFPCKESFSKPITETTQSSQEMRPAGISQIVALKQAINDLREFLVIVSEEKQPSQPSMVRLQQSINTLRNSLKSQNSPEGRSVLESMELLLKIYKNAGVSSQSETLAQVYQQFYISQTVLALNNQTLSYLRNLKRDKPKQFVIVCVQGYAKAMPDLPILMSTDICQRLYGVVDKPISTFSPNGISGKP
jgi:midasin (ATPase involved in ribosome maturation)